MAKTYLIALDIGSFLTKGMLFEVENDIYKPIACKKLKSDGIINGEIQDVESIRKTIITIINNLNSELPKKAKDAEIIVGYSTNSLLLTQEDYTIEYKEKTEIKDIDLKIIKKSITKKYDAEGKIILDSNFVHFVIDDKTVKNPVSFFAQRSLGTALNIVWTTENAFALLGNVFKKIDIIDSQRLPIFDSTLSLAYTVTTPVDRDVGVTVFDFGYHMCRIIIFKNGIPKLYYAFPYGIKYVLKDITNVLKTTEKEAHRLLVENAYCLRDTKAMKRIDYQLVSGNSSSFISQNLLNKIVFARIREIISRLNGELSKIGYEKAFEVGALQGGIVYTGGGAQIKNIEQTIKELMGENFRKGSLKSNLFEEIDDQIKNDSDYLSVFGIVSKYHYDKINSLDIEDIEEKETSERPVKTKEKKGIWKKFINKLAGGEDDAF